MEPCHPFVGVCDRDQLQRLQQCRYVRRGLLLSCGPRRLLFRGCPRLYTFGADIAVTDDADISTGAALRLLFCGLRGGVERRRSHLSERAGRRMLAFAYFALYLVKAFAQASRIRRGLLLNHPLASPPELGTQRSCGCTPYLVLSAQRRERGIIVGGTLANV